MENNNIPKAVWREGAFPLDGAEEEPSLELSVPTLVPAAPGMLLVPSLAHHMPVLIFQSLLTV